MMKTNKSDPKKSSPIGQKDSKTAYFSEQLQALWQICPELGSYEDFSRLIDTDPSTISKIVNGKSTTKVTRVMGQFLPIFIAYGAVTTADDARRLIEPPFDPIKKDKLKTICDNILGRQYSFLISLSNADRDNVLKFASTIDESYSTHPDPYTLIEVTGKPEIKSNLDLRDYYLELAHRHHPDAEKKLFEAYREERDDSMRSFIIDCLAMSGCEEAIGELPKLMGDDPEGMHWKVISSLPPESFHRAKRLWLELSNHASESWRGFAAHVIAQDSDQCEMEHVMQLALEGKINHHHLDQLDPRISPSVLIQLLNNLRKETSIEGQGLPYTYFYSWPHPIDWRCVLLERSLRELANHGCALPNNLRLLVADVILRILKKVSTPQPSAIRCLAFPDFRPWTPKIIGLLSLHLVDWARLEEWQDIAVAAMETIIALDVPQAKEFLLDIYASTTLPYMRFWAMETLRTKTDMRFNFRQRRKYKLESIYQWHSIPRVSQPVAHPFTLEELRRNRRIQDL